MMHWSLLAMVVFLLSLRAAKGDYDIDSPVDLGFGMPVHQEANSFGPPSRDHSKGLQEFQPIRNAIIQSATQYYSFSVNTTSGLGEYYELLIFLTGNICSQPDNVETGETSLAVYYSFNSSMFENLELGQMVLFENGYFQALADVPTKDIDGQDPILYIAVRAPENTNRTASWLYEIGVSQNDLTFQWDDRSWASLVDTDDNSALIVTGPLTNKGNQNVSQFNVTRSKYSLYIYTEEYRHYFDKLNSSWCAVRNGPALMSTSSFNSSFSSRGGTLRQQFYVSGLNSSTTYIAYLLSDFSGNDFGGAVYQPFELQTLGEAACELIYDLAFCDQVAYAVPAGSGKTKDELKDLYDSRANSLYQNFSKAMQQIACNTTDDAIFSPVRSCQNCANSYKNWLCAVTIPRCSTRDIEGYKYRSVNESRNEFINQIIQPPIDYYEVLPCVNVCHAMVRDCPATFGFQCPKHNDTIALSYYWDDSSAEYDTCNYLGRHSQSSFARRLVANYGLLIAVVLLHLTL